MTLEQAKLLINNGVKLEFVVDLALDRLGYWLSVSKPGELLEKTEFISTARKPEEPRFFKSLDVIYTFVSLQLNQSFTVRSGSGS
jgi:hypothetical protein